MGDNGGYVTGRRHLLGEIAEPCGALVVLEWIEGNEARVRWCERQGGPCPFPGADHSRGSQRPCGAADSASSHASPS